MSALHEAARAALNYIEEPPAKLWPAGTLHRITIDLRTALAAAEAQPVDWPAAQPATWPVISTPPAEPVALDHLLAYGYAPGDYMGGCRSCGEMQTNIDKRAICCRRCAELKHARAASAPAAPAQAPQPLDYFRVQAIADDRRLDYNELSAAIRDYLGAQP